MRIAGDFHLHTRVSDGHCDVWDHADAARARGLDVIAITDHSFLNRSCGHSSDSFFAQRKEIEGVTSVKVLQGIEGNIIDFEGTVDVPPELLPLCSPLIVGFHPFLALAKKKSSRRFILSNGFCGDGARERNRALNTQAYLKAMERYPVDVIAHPGHRFPVDFGALGEACAKNGVYFELNERHLGAIKGLDGGAVEALVSSGVNFILGSDAHRANKPGRFQAVEKFALTFGIPENRIFGIEGNMPEFKDKRKWTDELSR